MAVKVVDTSAIAAFLFGEAGAEDIASQLAGASLVAPSLLDLALATGLSAYDASYLWLARDLGAELVTLDRQLAKAAATI